ncbi:MAG: MFS transporter [Cyclobacteriaceae bacterium]|nr:MFS transporter [Cyclobacteriaceae bacterium]
MIKKKESNRAWWWVPSLYFTEGLPYILVISVSVILYKNLGVSNSDIGLYTSLLYLPWVIKPLWSPIVDMLSTKRRWFFVMQILIAAAFLLIAFSLVTDHYFYLSLALFWMVAFASATNDIASDGYYMIGLSEKDQSFFLGIRSLFYRLSMITGQGLIVVIAGYFESTMSTNAQAWSLTMTLVAGLMFVLAFVNYYGSSSRNSIVEEKVDAAQRIGFLEVFISFFRKKQMGIALTFILMYRLGESQLVKMASPFFLDDPTVGGLGLSTNEVGTIYGIMGVVALSLGGILGGIAISKDGLRKWMIPMILSLNLPNLLFVFLAFSQSTSVIFAGIVVFFEQFGYGFGFAAFLMYLIYIAEGVTKTSHYAIATGFMALGMMLPGMISGYIQEAIGYNYFFIWVVIAALPALIIAPYLKYPDSYGKKDQ